MSSAPFAERSSCRSRCVAALFAAVASIAILPLTAPAFGADACTVDVSVGGRHEGPVVAADPGGLYVGWFDAATPFGSVSADIGAQRVSPYGSALWGSYGVVACNAPQDQYQVSVLPDGAGGSFLAWFDARTAMPFRVYAQHLDENGTPTWAPNGVMVSDSVSNCGSPVLLSDGAGGILVAFCYEGGGIFSSRIQRVDLGGFRQWGPTGTRLGPGSVAAGVADDAGGAYVCMVVGDDLYAQKVNRQGVAQWAAGGLAVCTATGSQSYPLGITDGRGGAIFSWNDDRSGVRDVYAQHLNALGTGQWFANGVFVATQCGQDGLVSDGNGGAIALVYKFVTGAGYRPFVQRLNSSGNSMWNQPIGIQVSAAAGDQQGAGIASDAQGGAIVMWHGLPSGFNWHVYAQRISATGTRLWDPNGIQLCGTPTAPYRNIPMAPDGIGGAYGVWLTPSGTTHPRTLIGTRISANGTPNSVLGVGDRPLAAGLDLAVSPNPARRSLEIRFRLPAATKFDLSIHDLAGRRVFGIQETSSAGESRSVRWDRRDARGREVPPGVYLVSVRTAEASASRHCLVLR